MVGSTRILILFAFFLIGRTMTASTMRKEVSSHESADQSIEWVWNGALTSTSVLSRVKLLLPAGKIVDRKRSGPRISSQQHEISLVLINILEMPADPKVVRITYWLQNDGKSIEAKNFEGSATTNARVIEVLAFGLRPKGRYRWQIDLQNALGEVEESQMQRTSTKSGTISLPAAERTPFNFTFAMASCADENSSPEVFNSISKHNPLFFLHMGDLHYENIKKNSIQRFRDGYDKLLRSPSGRGLLGMGIPVIYMWDDHDYGPDNSDGTAPGREAAIASYKEYVPHYPIPVLPGIYGPSGPIPQAFTIGAVRFIISDLRSERTPNFARNSLEKSVLGPHQKKWFLQELLRAKNDADIRAIVWCSTMPWLDDVRKWGYFGHEREEIADFIKQHGLEKNITIVSGDAHMLAVDDGSHSAGQMVVLHAAALGRSGSLKGGPYSHGAFPGSGQFGIVEVLDDGHKICLHFTGSSVKTSSIVSYDTCNPEKTPGNLYRGPNPLYGELNRIIKKIKRIFRLISSQTLFKALLMLVTDELLVIIATSAVAYVVVFFALLDTKPSRPILKTKIE